ncbi:histidine phosphatase family protein [Paenibacillus kobensis]|uniref:histidine phosphatase family protein n=1 Tax=Paenibacillus kobensis TaxID=59841 RepID=UPI000FD9EB56|nr:histidine phosphatase family protein [Paenibacillus kobensis]
MTTTVYLIRHAESEYVEGAERSRGLSVRGERDAQRVSETLKGIEIYQLVSSPYERAIATIKPLADNLGLDITLIEDLRERTIGDFGDAGFREAKLQVYEHFQFAYPQGGESSAAAQARAAAVMNRLLEQYEGQSIAIGTHGDIMTLMLHYFNAEYGYTFWQSTTMPDIYKLTFDGKRLESVERLWRAESFD